MNGDYEILLDFWEDVFQPREGRTWAVASTFDGDFWLRDAFAWGLVRDNLHKRRDVRFVYVNPAIAAEAAPRTGEDILFIGRPKLFIQSELSPFATRLAVRARGEFRDFPSGAPGDSIRYGTHTFRRHELETWPESYRRSDLDYAVLQIATETVAGEPRLLVSLAGVSALGTMGLAMILSNEAHRAKIAQEVAALLPWTSHLKPREYLEVCIRVAVGGDAALRNFLNDRKLDFGVEAVVVHGAEQPRFRVEEVRVQLKPGTNGRGTVVVDESPEPLELGASRFQLLRWLVEHPQTTRTEDLFGPLNIAPPASEAAKRAASVRVAKTVHDLNELFRTFEVFRERSAIESKKQRYVLNAQATVVPARAA